MVFEARVASVHVSQQDDSLVTDTLPRVQVVPGGVVGDKHFGATRSLDVRDRQALKIFGIKPDKGLEVRNWREWSGVSVEELAIIAYNLGVTSVSPALLGANFCFEGIPSFTQLPRGSMLYFPEGEAVLTVEEENQPCIGPGNAIAAENPGVEASKFVALAMGLRGLVGIVYKGGSIGSGDKVLVAPYQSKHYSFSA